MTNVATGATSFISLGARLPQRLQYHRFASHQRRAKSPSRSARLLHSTFAALHSLPSASKCNNEKKKLFKCVICSTICIVRGIHTAHTSAFILKQQTRKLQYIHIPAKPSIMIKNNNNNKTLHQAPESETTSECTKEKEKETSYASDLFQRE